MKGTKGYYSLVQFCPDASRAEAANVGVLLSCPDMGFVRARLSRGNDRVRKFFQISGDDLDRVNAAKQAIVSRLEVDGASFRSLEDLQRFIQTRANEIVVTPPRPMKVFDPEEDLDRLFDELVGGRSTPRATAREADAPALDTALRQPKFQGRIRYDQRVEVPVVHRSLHIPYLYQNGVVNLVKPQRFSSSEAGAMNTAMRLAVEGDLLQRHCDPGAQRRFIVVSQFDEPETQMADAVLELFGEYDVRCVHENGIPDYVSEVDQEAHAEQEVAQT